MKNFYKVLGVRENATSKEVKAAYRNLMKKWHPDRCQHVDATRRTEEVSLAYRVLSSPESRFNHDLRLRKAGLSSKPLFIKRTKKCIQCEGTGTIVISTRRWYHVLFELLGFKYEDKKDICRNCCGIGIEHKIQEI